MTDIYLTPAYARLYETMEQGKAEEWVLNSPHGRISYTFIKRKIESETEQDYYDITTPYGYGGPVVLEVNDKVALLAEFEQAFKEYCQAENIVSEFIRFHPILENATDFKTVYQPIYLRQTVGTSVDPEGQTPLLEFNQSTRKLVRRAEKQGVTYRVVTAPENLDDFLAIYYATMDRNQADTFYYFDRAYFEACVAVFKENLVLIEVSLADKVIGACIYFRSGKVLHEHLMGSLTDYLSYSPVYVLKHAAVQWAAEEGIELIHYGGGLSNAEDDPLFQFKRKFTKSTLFDFYIGKKIHLPEVYDQICQSKGISSDDPFFPAYRKR